MFDDLAAFFYENVVAAFTDYSKIRQNDPYGRSRDIRAAIDTATSLYHLREHIPAQYRKSRSEVAKLCPDYDLLGDVANAAKHDDLTRGKPQIKSADDIYELTVITRYEKIPVSCLGGRANGTLGYESTTGQIWRDRGRGKALHA